MEALLNEDYDPRLDPASPDFDPDYDPAEEYIDDYVGPESTETNPFDVFDEDDVALIDAIVDKAMMFTEVFSGMPWRSYQRPMARRLWESLVSGDGAEITCLAARQSGKSQIIANVLAAAMVLLPRLAKSFPKLLGKYERGLWVGVFAPVEDQAATIWGRIVQMLESEHGTEVLLDPEIDESTSNDKLGEKAPIIRLTGCNSHARLQTCNPKAKIESKTYHVVVVDEAQDADGYTIKKSIRPMLSSVNGSTIMSGTAVPEKGYFYSQIQANKRRWTNHRGRRARCDHVEWNWRPVAKENAEYARFIAGEKTKIGEHSMEFQMAYECRWPLSQGMFVTEDDLTGMLDVGMPIVKQWVESPCIVGIDMARKNDSTVVTVCWVNWDYPDQWGHCEHRVLNWLELTDMKYEDQYFEIFRFLGNYKIWRIGIDAQGAGGPAAERLQLIFQQYRPGIEVVALDSGDKAQNERWSYLQRIMDLKLLRFPGHSKATRLRKWQKWYQQMTDALRVVKGRYIHVKAPDEKDAFDDYVDSLCNAVWMSRAEAAPQVEVIQSPFYRRRTA